MGASIDQTRASGAGTVDSAGIDILFVCTANQCRSAIAEVMLRQRLQDRGIDAHVHSAGVFEGLEGGAPATEETLRVLTKRGFDASAHESRAATADMIR